LYGQRDFCEQYNSIKGYYPRTISPVANAMTIRTISIRHALSDLETELNPIVVVQNHINPYISQLSSNLVPLSSVSGSVLYYPVLSNKNPSGTFPQTWSHGEDYFYAQPATLMFNKPISLFNLQSALYQLYLNLGSSLDRMIREIALLYGDFPDWDSMRKIYISKLDSSNIGFFSRMNCANIMNQLSPDFIAFLTTPVKIRHTFAHRGYVSIEESNNSFYFHCTPDDDNTSLMSDDIMKFSSDALSNCIALIDKAYCLLMGDMTNLV
jgi:hypothetical protein